MDFWKNIILYCWIIEQMVIAVHIMFAQNLGIIDHHILLPSCRTLRHEDGHFWEIGKCMTECLYTENVPNYI